MKISRTVLINQLGVAAVNRRAAFLIEMAVGMAVYAQHTRVDKTSRAELYGLYGAVGYDCVAADGADYRTVHRRITAAGHLFEHTGAAAIETWCAGHSGADAVRAIVAQIAHLDVATVNGVLAMAGRPVTPRALPGPTEEPGGTPRRRAEDRGERIDVGHAHVVLDEGVTREDLIDLAAQLIELAKAR